MTKRLLSSLFFAISIILCGSYNVTVADNSVPTENNRRPNPHGNNSQAKPGSAANKYPSRDIDSKQLLKRASECRKKAKQYLRKAQIHFDKSAKYRHEADIYYRQRLIKKSKAATKKADKEMRQYKVQKRTADRYSNMAKDYERRAKRIR